MPNHVHILLAFERARAARPGGRALQKCGFRNSYPPKRYTTGLCTSALATSYHDQSSGTTTIFEPLDLHRPKPRPMAEDEYYGQTGRDTMNDKKKTTILSVVGLIALLIACVIGVQAILPGLGEGRPSWRPPPARALQAPERRSQDAAPDGGPSNRPPPASAPSAGRACPPPSSGASSAPTAGSRSRRRRRALWKRS